MEDAAWNRRISFLQAAHVHLIDHSRGTLLEHLIGTYRLLAAWNEPPAVCDAGLFHSVYGTEHFPTTAVRFNDRQSVTDIIGNEAERLAWLFGMMLRATLGSNMQRSSGYWVENRYTGERLEISGQEFQDLVAMSFANTLEALPRLSWSLRRACRRYLKQFETVATPAAMRALEGSGRKSWIF